MAGFAGTIQAGTLFEAEETWYKPRLGGTGSEKEEGRERTMKRVRFAGGIASCLAALLSLSGCASESRRPADEGAREAETPAALGEKTRVSVASVDIGRGSTSGKAVLTVQAIPPTTGWTIEIRPLAATTEETLEFEVVGRGPAGSAQTHQEPQVVRAEIELGGAVKHVVVYDEDDATVLERP